MEPTISNFQSKDYSLEFERVQMLNELFDDNMPSLWRKRNKERQVREGDIAMLHWSDTEEVYNHYTGKYEMRKVVRYRVGVVKFLSKTNALELCPTGKTFVNIAHQCNPAVIAPIELDWQQVAKDLLAMKDRKAQERIEEERRIEEARKAEQERLRLEEERQRKYEEERQAEEERRNAPAGITVGQYEELLARLDALEDEVRHNCVRYRDPLEE